MSVYQLVTYVLFILRIWRINAKFIRGTSLTNWADAKEFCDEEYEGIATISDAVELGEAQTECFKEGFSAMGCWIGLSAVISMYLSINWFCIQTQMRYYFRNMPYD